MFSSAKHLQSGMEYLEQLGALPAFITQRHQLHIQAVHTMAREEKRPQIRATSEQFVALGEHMVHWAWIQVFFAMGVAFTLCLTVSDVAAVPWGWLQYPGWFVFYDYKVNNILPVQPMAAFLETWRRWV